MARSAIHLPIFIASPGDLEKERKIACDVIKNLQSKISIKNILISVYMWESSRPTMLGSPQDIIDVYLKKCELAIVIFGNKLGLGTIHELELAEKMIYEGATDDILLYFKKEFTNSEIGDFKDKVRNSGLHYDFKNPNDFRNKLTKHISNWISRWEQIPQIYEFTLRNSGGDVSFDHHLGENQLTVLKRKFPFNESAALERSIGKKAVKLYQRGGPQSYLNVFHDNLNLEEFSSSQSDLEKTTPLVHLRKDEYMFRDADWFYFFCAVGLKDCILENSVEDVAVYPYVHPVHQYLRALLIFENEMHVLVLRNWLTNQNRITAAKPIARNFAAYVLGMLNAKIAENDLAFAARHDTGSEVRLYSIISLGRLKSRLHLDLLVEFWNSSTLTERQKIFLGQSITNTIGLTNYPL